jgi:hypothetical protein
MLAPICSVVRATRQENTMSNTHDRAGLMSSILSLSSSPTEKREALRQLAILDQTAKEERAAEERAILRRHWAQRIAEGK